MKNSTVCVGILMAAILVCLTSSANAGAQISKHEYNILDYGATRDGNTLNTAAINKAIKTCAESGGGTVIISPGKYLSGPIEILSNVTLHLESGATIKGSSKLEDYAVEQVRASGESARAGLVTARDANNVAITGGGVIDGSGMDFVYPDKIHTGSDYDKKFTRQKENFMNPRYGTQHGPLAHGERPGNLVRLLNCRGVLISGVIIQNSPTWTVQIARCKNVNIFGVNINSFASGRRVPNDDGIDLVNSSFVHISGCDIQTGDDCIAVFGSEKLTVSNCTLSSRSSGIRVGFNRGNIKDCTFSNLVIHTSNRGLGVFVRGAGSIENVLFSDIAIQTQLFTGHWWGKGEPIHVSAMPWDPNTSKIGHIKDVRFSNIIAESESGILVYGCKESVIKNLSFENIKVKIKNSPLNSSYGGNFDLRSTSNMATAMFEHDIPAMYCSYVEGLNIHGMDLECDGNLPAFFSHGIQCEHFRNIDIDGFRGRQPHAGDNRAAIAVNDGSGVTIRNCRAGEGTGVFLSCSAIKDERLFANNDLSSAKKAFEPAAAGFKLFGNVLPVEGGEKK